MEFDARNFCVLSASFWPSFHFTKPLPYTYYVLCWVLSMERDPAPSHSAAESGGCGWGKLRSAGD